MKSTDATTQITTFQRLKSFGQALLALVLLLGLVLYGTIFMTNGLTQLKHAETWLYFTVMAIGLSSLWVLLLLSYGYILRHVKRAFSSS